MRRSFTFKFLGVLALAISALTAAAEAGTRSTGYMGPGVAVPPSNSYATMPGY
ncbi:MAG: hypothetical protein MPJ78_18085 [Hyphomicrobiaceae bacterium]|nr:hypothetical protein [Hyphomicrobiaceae bacterium]